MSSHETRVWNTPGEEHLASLMNNASKKLLPQDGYSLDINMHGVMPDIPTFQELQSHFGLYLDRDWGSNIQLHLQDDTSLLELSHLTAQLIENVGQVDLQKINPGHSMPYLYLPEVDFRGSRVEASRFAWDPRWQQDLSERMLAGHGLQPNLGPVRSAEEFRMRIGQNILSRCQNWFMKERLVINQYMLGESVVRICIARQQNVSNNIDMSRDLLSIIREEESLEDPKQVISSRQKLDLVSLPHTQRFMLTRYTESKARNATATPSRNTRQARHRHAEADTIAEFTSLVQPVLEND